MTATVIDDAVRAEVASNGQATSTVTKLPEDARKFLLERERLIDRQIEQLQDQAQELMARKVELRSAVLEGMGLKGNVTNFDLADGTVEIDAS
jgi:hypothetical protein